MSGTIKIEIELDMWQRNHQALISSRENTLDLLNEHVLNLGMDTKKNKYIADMYEKEIREINSLLEYSVNNSGAD